MKDGHQISPQFESLRDLRTFIEALFLRTYHPLEAMARLRSLPMRLAVEIRSQYTDEEARIIRECPLRRDIRPEA